MSEIKFFTPIHYGALAKSAEEKAIKNIDNYFNICGQKRLLFQVELTMEKKKLFFK